MSESFGIMDGGYFVPRTQLLRWINESLQLRLTVIEQLASGAVYCQLLDAVCPGIVPLHKLNWKAKTEYEFIQNLKVLQLVFDRVGMTKKLDVRNMLKQIMKLAKGKYQDNLEFIQWLKRFIESQGGCRPDYDAEARRGNVQIDFSFAEKKSNNKENLKKVTSMTNLQRSPTNFLRNCTELLAEHGCKTPKKPLGLMQRSITIQQTKKEPQSGDKKQTKSQLTQIKQILKEPKDTEKQISEIRQLLEVVKIVEEDQQGESI